MKKPITLIIIETDRNGSIAYVYRGWNNRRAYPKNSDNNLTRSTLTRLHRAQMEMNSKEKPQ